MQRTRRCPKCRVKCVAPAISMRRNPSSICIADYSGEGPVKKLADDEFKIRIWSYMKPPKISEPIVAVNPERVEMVRKMLDKSLREKPSQVQIDSNVNLQVLPDGSIQKTTSRIERKIFPPKSRSPVQRPGTYKDFAANIGNIMSSTRM